MKGSEFVRKIKRLGARKGLPVDFVPKRGKGRHGTLYRGSARTIVQDLKREIPTGALHARQEGPRCAVFPTPPS